MNQNFQFRALALAGCAMLSVAPFAHAASGPNLKLNGKIASTRVKTIGGIAYVPVADIAKALGQSVVPMAGGLEIKTPSGTFQAGKMTGKIGDVFQTKKYSFQVLGFKKVDSYPSQYLKLPETFEPQSPSDTLVIVSCSIKNTLPKAQGPVLAHSYAGNTAIADTEGQSYPPYRYDSRIASDFSGASMLPGSKINFAVVFSVPKSAVLKDLVFTITDYFDPDFKGPDVRVSLK